jgi:hypothetical protein
MNALSGRHIGVKSPKRSSKGETPAKSSYSNRTGDTETASVNRFARAVAQTTWFVTGKSVRGSVRPAVSLCSGNPKTPQNGGFKVP